MKPKQILVVDVTCGVACPKTLPDSCLKCSNFNVANLKVHDVLEDNRDDSELPPGWSPENSLGNPDE